MEQKKRIKRAKQAAVPTLSDADIVTLGHDRRSFLAKVGLGSAAVAAAAFAGACGGSDDCDNDSDLDPTDPQGDNCDTDGL